MSETKMWRYLAATLVACVTLTGVGCAQDVGDIDRSQPNKIKKSDFDQSQEWYYRMMIADSDVQGSLIFQGLMSETKRVRFFITEQVLFACSTTPVVEGELTETEFFEGEECYGVVAAFPIMGHFDVQRSYSTATGEQSNVIVENYSDRPWYDREYMRVNWGFNLVDGRGMYGSLLGRFSSVAWTPDQDPGFIDENRTRLKPDEGYLEATYTLLPLAEWLWLRRDSYGSMGLFDRGFTYTPAGERPAGPNPMEALFIPRSLESDGATTFGKSPFQWLVQPARSNTGQWFIDPAWTFLQRYSFPQEVSWSARYCYNLFLGEDVQNGTCPDRSAQ